MSSKQFEIKIGVNSGGVVTGINSAIGQINRLGTSIKSSLQAFGIGAVIKSTVESIIQWGAEIQKTARENGLGVESFQELSAASKELSIDVSDATTAFKKIQLAQVAAIKGNEDLRQAFLRQGITLERLRSLTPRQAFEEVGAAFEKAAPSAQTTADAVALMGKGAEKMVGAFRGGFIGAMREARELGEVVDKKVVASLVRADDAMTRFALQAKVAIASMIPPLVDLAGQLSDTAQTTILFFQSFFMAKGNYDQRIRAGAQSVAEYFKEQTRQALQGPKPKAKKPAADQDASNVTSNANGNTLAKPDSDKLLNIGGYRGGGEIARIPAQQLRVQQRMEQHLGRIAHYAEGSFASRTNDPELKSVLYKVDRFFNTLGAEDLE